MFSFNQVKYYHNTVRCNEATERADSFQVKQNIFQEARCVEMYEDNDDQKFRKGGIPAEELLTATLVYRLVQMSKKRTFRVVLTNYFNGIIFVYTEKLQFLLDRIHGRIHRLSVSESFV